MLQNILSRNKHQSIEDDFMDDMDKTHPELAEKQPISATLDEVRKQEMAEQIAQTAHTNLMKLKQDQVAEERRLMAASIDNRFTEEQNDCRNKITELMEEMENVQAGHNVDEKTIARETKAKLDKHNDIVKQHTALAVRLADDYKADKAQREMRHAADLRRYNLLIESERAKLAELAKPINPKPVEVEPTETPENE